MSVVGVNGRALTDAVGNDRPDLPAGPPTYLLDRGFPAEVIREVGWRVQKLGAAARRYGLPPEAQNAVGWLIPYRHRNGRVRFERLRLIDPADVDRFHKYRQPHGVSLALYDPYGALDIEPLEELLLVEGEANAVAVHVALPGLPVIGLPGQTSLKAEMAEELGHIPHVHVWIDHHDPNADRNAAAISRRLLEVGVGEVRFLPHAGGMDANDQLRELGPELAGKTFQEMLDRAAPLEPEDQDPWAPLPRPSPPSFPVDALGPEIEAFVTALATQTQTPPDLTALAVLGALSSVALGARVDCGNFDEETLGLYILAVSPSGDRKSTVLKKVAAPLYRIELEARQGAKTRKAECEANRELLQTRKKALTSRASKLDQDDDDWAPTRIELEKVTAELAASEEFVEPRLLTDDATPEGLAELLAHHPNGVAVLSAESAVIDNLLGHYSDRGKANLHVVCKAYNGERASVDRRGTPALIIPRPALGITLFAQQHVLTNVLGHNTARGQGLIGRFILVDASAASYVGRRQIDPPPPAVPPHVHEAWQRIVEKVRAACSATEPTKGGFVDSVAPGDVQFLTLSLSPSSKRLLTEIEASVEPRQADGADLATYRDWISRHHGRIARIAGLLHLAERSPDHSIAIDTMQRAARIGDYILEHGLLVLSAPDERLRRAQKWLARQDESIVSRRDLHYGLLGGHVKVDAAAELIDELVDHRALRKIDDSEGPGPKGGRPRGPRYEINPYLRGGAR